jgi:tape measure domain-containing protein
MAIREELTLGIQNFQANLDRARSDVRKTAGEMSRDMRNVGGGPGGAGGGGIGGGIMGTVIGSVRAFAPALTALAAFRQGVEAVSVSMERQRAEMALGAVSTEDVGDQLDRLRELGESPGLGFDQVVAASTRLQAVGISAELAEKAILEMGNALALVGGGKEQLDGVMLAMTQIVAKGTVSAEEINQIAERLPQIRRLMQDAFGTADTEALQKLGIGSEEFIAGIVEAAGELERAAMTSSSAMSNLQDDWKDFMQSMGDFAEPAMLPIFETLSGLLEKSSVSVAAIKDDLEKAAFSSLGVSTNKEARDNLLRGEGSKTPEPFLRSQMVPEGSRPPTIFETIDEYYDDVIPKPELTPSEKAAKEKSDKDQQTQLENFEKAEGEANRDAERRRIAAAEQRDRDAEQRAREAEAYQESAFARLDPEAQMESLRDRMAKSLGIDAVGSTAEIEAGAADLAKRGKFAEATAVLSDLASLEAIAGRQGGARAQTSAGQGSLATLMDEIFGRNPAADQLEESRRAAEAGEKTSVILDKILIKMDEPPPRDTFSDNI